jgi:hypothetical protein
MNTSNNSQIETDYLIIGSGAAGMAFADVLLDETDANITIIDKYHKPGGHWNMAYPFVTLHQPSAFYGVSSVELSRGRKDEVGLNKGLSDLATGAEIMAYYDDVMRHRFLPSGRVQYFPSCEYHGDGTFSSMLSGQTYKAKVKKKVVDTTYLNTAVPSTHKPSFAVDPTVPFIPLNDLPKIKTPPVGFVIIGGGKTGIDAVLWLLERGVDPDNIRWIMPRDAWLLDRKNTQPTEEFFEYSMGAQAAQFEALAEATSITDLFDRLETAGVLLRIDKNVRPKMFHGATISQLELEQLRRVKKIIRMGRVTHITNDKIHFDEDSISTSVDHVHVDCSASAITQFNIKPVFDGNMITPQTVRSYQPVFSAAFIAHIEANFEDEKEKNHLCTVVPLPNHDTDWLKMLSVFMMNQYNWNQNKELRTWLRNNRLDGFSAMVANVSKEDEAKQSILRRLRSNAMPAMMKLNEFMTQLS